MDFYSKKKMPVFFNYHLTEEVIYEVDELKVRGMLMTPNERVNRIVVYLRGGKGQVGRVRPGRMAQFKEKHTLVFAPYYRGSNGSEGRDEFCGDDLHDVIKGIEILKSHYPNVPVHMIGFSRGGIQGLLTYQKVKATSYIIWGGVSDLLMMYEERIDLRGMLKRMVGHPKKQYEAYARRNALQSIHKDSPPILIVHGDEDKQVNINMAYHLEEHLKQEAVDHQTIYLSGEGHVLRPEIEKQTLLQIKEWMYKCEKSLDQ
ncbi:prolyl oligopeptidase family serine peptidase [Mammaliicoccus sciuri]|uniref:alpha/beta hydrolase family protein n=1 Tax=Mammaliicoccus sciuri TaxID=1296 RepID=UPI0019531D76|nr:prolyl oligopeptidase family serine peptidase [Mammaliicoccus sciuri]MCD8874111.1 prolyl oligopeptidase family serine peptidase [Mammaliicoccus sciuri]MEB6214652.1 prolyl oligopeptidase family serine peptidase [Mammaliicoccus sciuri]MEB6329813.1 prolyl oligopeptidase family serine peptidase [Mammaliicoccus sciuri]MEB7408355.1 prolyl oligopeptidase family serine peptidase [Mammaliicoccus sciuri]